MSVNDSYMLFAQWS